jgi:hypothetical protein
MTARFSPSPIETNIRKEASAQNLRTARRTVDFERGFASMKFPDFR